jgi:hypothetical protein
LASEASADVKATIRPSVSRPTAPSKRPRRYWTPEEDARLRELYPDATVQTLCAEFGRHIRQIYARAHALGLRRSAEYLASPAACRLRRGDNPGIRTRFQPGHKTWNAGMKGYSAPGTEATRWQKGNLSHTWQPIGTEVVDSEGYLKRKISNLRAPARRDWKFVHVLVWEAEHGPVPPGHAVVFRNGNKADIRLENLELITRAELMRRNSIHRWPRELRDVMRLAGKLKQTIEERDEKQD